MNPKNEEFFTEGKYKPPAPFMELARNPSDKNIERWFKYIELKNSIMERLNLRMKSYLAKRKKVKSISILEESPYPIKSHPDFKRFRLRMYFESSCPHCKRMFKTLHELREKGFYVEVLQIDSKPYRPPYPFTVVKANKAELVKHGIKSWPFLLIADLKRKALLTPVVGYRSTEQIEGIFRQASK